MMFFVVDRVDVCIESHCGKSKTTVRRGQPRPFEWSFNQHHPDPMSVVLDEAAKRLVRAALLSAINSNGLGMVECYNQGWARVTGHWES